MKILHIGSIAGIPQILSKYQGKMGHKSDVLAFRRHPFGYEVDFYYPIRKSYPLGSVEKLYNFFKIFNNYDIYHFHWGSLLPRRGIDLPIWKAFKKRVIIHHHGSDIRGKKEKTLYKLLANQIFVSTPDLLKFAPEATWIPDPIDLEKLPYVGVKSNSDEIKIIHAPSNRAKKGTEHVIKAVDQLRRDGYEVSLILIENMSHEQAVEYYTQADIVVDQLLIGWYGIFAIECMALGKPVCVYILEDLEHYIPTTPVFNTSSKNIVENLRLLIEDKKLRKQLGKEGRKYAEKVHDASKITKRVISFYEG